RLHRGGARRAPREDAVAKAGREALDLGLDGVLHRFGRSVRGMAVCVSGVLALRRARIVEMALLAHHHERLSRMLPAPGGALAGGDLLEVAADVHRRSAPAARVAPRDLLAQGVVDLVHAGAI